MLGAFPSRVPSLEAPTGFKALPGPVLWSQRASVPPPTALTLLTNNKISSFKCVKKRLSIPFLESVSGTGHGNYIKDTEKYQFL